MSEVVGGYQCIVGEEGTMERRRVVFVAQGSWGDVREDDPCYTSQAEGLRQIVEAARRHDPDSGKEVPAATFEVVTNIAALREQCGRYPRPDVVIFRSRGMLDAAREIVRVYPRVRVIVYTGLIPEGEVIFVEKGWILDDAVLRSILFS